MYMASGPFLGECKAVVKPNWRFHFVTRDLSGSTHGLTLLHSEWPELHRALAVLIAIGLKNEGFTQTAHIALVSDICSKASFFMIGLLVNVTYVISGCLPYTSQCNITLLYFTVTNQFALTPMVKAAGPHSCSKLTAL